MIALVIQILFPVERPGRLRPSLSWWLHTDAQRLARKVEPLFSRVMLVAAGGLALMMVVRILAAWAQGRL